MSLLLSLSQVLEKHVIKLTKILQSLTILVIRWLVVTKTIMVSREMALSRENFLYLIAKMSVSNEMLISLTILWCPSGVMTGCVRALVSVDPKLTKTKTIV